jgi:hypothetical protein
MVLVRFLAGFPTFTLRSMPSTRSLQCSGKRELSAPIDKAFETCSVQSDKSSTVSQEGGLLELTCAEQVCLLPLLTSATLMWSTSTWTPPIHDCGLQGLLNSTLFTTGTISCDSLLICRARSQSSREAGFPESSKKRRVMDPPCALPSAKARLCEKWNRYKRWVQVIYK